MYASSSFSSVFVRNELHHKTFDEETGKYSETTALRIVLWISTRYAELMVDILYSKPNHVVGDAAPSAIIELV